MRTRVARGSETLVFFILCIIVGYVKYSCMEAYIPGSRLCLRVLANSCRNLHVSGEPHDYFFSTRFSFYSLTEAVGALSADCNPRRKARPGARGTGSACHTVTASELICPRGQAPTREYAGAPGLGRVVAEAARAGFCCSRGSTAALPKHVPGRRRGLFTLRKRLALYHGQHASRTRRPRPDAGLRPPAPRAGGSGPARPGPTQPPPAPQRPPLALAPGTWAGPLHGGPPSRRRRSGAGAAARGAGEV